jgi:hypothetical protein
MSLELKQISLVGKMSEYIPNNSSAEGYIVVDDAMYMVDEDTEIVNKFDEDITDLWDNESIPYGIPVSIEGRDRTLELPILTKIICHYQEE